MVAASTAEGAASRATNPAPAGRAPLPAVVTEALPALLQRGAEAFAAGDFPTAAAAFAQVERDFASEADWRGGTLPRRLLPLRGFAELRAGLAQEAGQSLATFLERFPDDGAQRAFALFALATALRQSGQFDEALRRFAQYEAENAGTPQAALGAYQRGELLLELDRTDEALATWRALAEGGAAESLRVPARLRALQVALEKHRDDEAAVLLLDEPWAVSTMPEIAVLTFAALEAGDRLLAAGRPGDALRAYRLVAPKAQLVATQASRLGELKVRFASQAGRVAMGGGSFWVDFYRERLARLEGQQKALEAAEDYTLPLRLRIGQAHLLAGRPREAWLAFESVATDPAAAPDLRRDGHYRWILAAAELALWEDALAIARAFVERFPESDLAPEAFHLIARAHLEQQRFDAADEVLTDLLVRFPQHPSAGRALFTRGWTRAMREQYAGARADFERYRVDHPQGPLLVHASLWRALTWFFERRHTEALAGLDEAAKLGRGHPLEPEILYRRGATLYAMRDLPRARRVMEEFIGDFGRHPRQPDALVLLGDILMGAGELELAKQRFASIDPEAVAAFAHGVFQTGKILKSGNDLAGMVEHFTAYLARVDAARLPRRSEALHWIGWAEEQRGHLDAALPAYLEVLSRFGNDPQAGEVEGALAGLERLCRRLQRESASAIPALADNEPMKALRSGNFERWLESERTHARETRRLTWFVRLAVYIADRHAGRKQPHQEEVVLLELAGAAPLESFDAHACARVGLALQQIGSVEGARFLRHLLANHPRSFERGAAFLGLAAEAVRTRSFEEAQGWIARFENETPTHPLAPRVALLAGSALEQAGRPAEAAERYEALLHVRNARGRPHAEALLGLARCHATLGARDKAVACCQRVYTLHRAQRDLVADAYLRSAGWFRELGDLRAAAATCREMLNLADIGDADQRHAAQTALNELVPLLPPELPETAGPAGGAGL